MVVMDTTVLLLLFQPDAKPPRDPATAEEVTRCKDRIDLLLQQLSDAGTQIIIPTPVLSELLVAAGPDKLRMLREIESSYAFKIQPFDTMAAIEVAMLTDSDLQSGKLLDPNETKAKVKYDRQIIAIAKVNKVKVIYSDDIGLGKKAEANGITVISTAQLPLPPKPPQSTLPL